MNDEQPKQEVKPSEESFKFNMPKITADWKWRHDLRERDCKRLVERVKAGESREQALLDALRKAKVLMQEVIEDHKVSNGCDSKDTECQWCTWAKEALSAIEKQEENL